MAISFEAQVGRFVRESQKRMEAVFKQSAQEVFAIAQRPVGGGGNMPVDTGTLRASLQTGLNNSEGVTGPDSYVAVIAGAGLGDTIFGGWTAEYAAYQHFVIGHLWVDKAVQHWQRIVAENARRLEALSR